MGYFSIKNLRDNPATLKWLLQESQWWLWRCASNIQDRLVNTCIVHMERLDLLFGKTSNNKNWLELNRGIFAHFFLNFHWKFGRFLIIYLGSTSSVGSWCRLRICVTDASGKIGWVPRESTLPPMSGHGFFVENGALEDEWLVPTPRGPFSTSMVVWKRVSDLSLGEFFFWKKTTSLMKIYNWSPGDTGGVETFSGRYSWKVNPEVEPQRVGFGAGGSKNPQPS